MRIASRTARRLDAFDRRFDSTITPILTNDAFVESAPYVFTRVDPLGQDVVYFDVETSSLIVRAGFCPKYMNEVDDLYANLLLPKEPMLGAASYLTPVCMTPRPKLYACRLAAQRDRSFDMVARGLNSHALAWLRSLRDPAAYADAVPPTMVMYVGRASEVAGRVESAKEAYSEMFRRLMIIWNDATFRVFAEFEGAREFVYLCLKMGWEVDKAERVMDAIKYRPMVAPFGSV